jgi:site-specific DNA recombinase
MVSRTRIRVAAYCRVSTNDQENSLPNQEKYFRELIAVNKDWTLVDIYSDEAKSGTDTKNRHGFNRMIANAMAGEIDLIVTKAVSRFARNTVDSLKITRDLKEKGVYVKFTLDNIDTRDNDCDLKLTIFAMIAQEESRKTSVSVKWGQKRRMEQGIVFGRNSMYGYKILEGKLDIIEEEAEIVRKIFNMYADGKGSHIIASELKEKGIKSKFKNDWSNTVILRLLRNEKYVGDLVQKKTFTPNYLTHDKKYNRGEEEKIPLINHHRGIVGRELWNKVQERLIENTLPDAIKKKHSNRYWCSGKILCGVCREKFVSKTKNLKNNTKYRAWRCIKAAMHGSDAEKGGCLSESVNEKVLLSSMQYVLSILNLDKDLIKREMLEEIQSLESIGDTTNEIKQLEASIKKQKEKIDRLIDLRTDREITKEQLEKKQGICNEEINRLNANIDNLRNLDKRQNKQISEIKRYMNEIDRILEFNDLSVNEIVFTDLLKRIVVSNANILEIYLKAIPTGIKLHYKSSGKMDTYKVTFDRVEFIDAMKEEK